MRLSTICVILAAAIGIPFLIKREMNRPEISWKQAKGLIQYCRHHSLPSTQKHPTAVPSQTNRKD